MGADSWLRRQLAKFGGGVCLDLNDEIVKIAKSGEGVAVYFH